jgi:hypothetical protein
VAVATAAATAAVHDTTTVATEGPVAAAGESQAAARTGRQGAAKVDLTTTAAEDRPTMVAAAAEVPEGTPAEAVTAPTDEAGSATKRTTPRASRLSRHNTDLSPQIYLIFLMCLSESINFPSLFSSVWNVSVCTLGTTIFRFNYSPLLILAHKPKLTRVLFPLLGSLRSL